MAEITTVLLVLGVILAVVTVIGHGIWVAGAALFGSRGSKQSTAGAAGPMTAGRRACPRCGTAFGLNEHDCGVCGWPTAAVERTPGQAALRSVGDQVERLARLGLMDADARDKLIAAVAQEEQRVIAAAQAAAREAPSPGSIARHPLPEGEGAARSVAAGTAPAPMLAEAPLPAPLAERARKYAASRGEAAAELEAEQFTAGPAIPPKRREAMSRLLAAFMEEKNIRWGELVGGLLIVGCSIALVISFWSQIAKEPLLRFGLFNGVTAALFGVGMYTDRRWKIHTTSHGVLVIATLLVPLNFLAIAAFTQESPPTGLLSLTGEGVSLVVFALLVYFAGRILVPNDAVLLVVGVMIPCLMQLLVRRFAEPGTALGWLYVLAGVPIASYLASTSAVARKRWQEELSPDSITRHPLPEGEGFDETEAQRLLAFLGLVSAATLLPLALLSYKVPPLETTLHRLSPLVTACGLPALLVGLLFWRRTDGRSGGWGRGSAEPPAADTIGGSLSLAPSHPSVALQTAGIGVGALGALVMAGAVALAWPDPATLLPTALVTAAVLTAVAVWFGIPAAHVPAGVALAAAWLVGFHLARGNVTWTLDDYGPMSEALLRASSGHALVPLVGVFGALAWWLRRSRLGATGSASAVGRETLAEPVAHDAEPVAHDAGFMYALVTAATAAASLALVVWFGFGRAGDPENITGTLAIYALAALGAAALLDRADVARIGSALVLVALGQAIVYRFNPEWQLEQPWIVALLAHATLAASGCGALCWLAQSTGKAGGTHASHTRANLYVALVWSGLVTSVAAAAWIAVTVQSASAGTLAVNLAWLGGVWLALAVLVDWPVLFGVSQVALVLAIVCGVTAAVETREWYTTARHAWLDPWFLEAHGIALAGYCLVLTVVRWLFARLAKPQVADRPWGAAGPAVDRVIEVGLVALLALVAIYAVVPGVAQELALSDAPGIAARVVPQVESFEIWGIAHQHAADRGAWLLLAAVGVTLAAGLWQFGVNWRLIGLLVTAAAVCPLVAARGLEPIHLLNYSPIHHAGWESEVAVASALRWLTAGFFLLVSVPIWLRERVLVSDNGLVRPARDLLVTLVALVYVAMGVYVAGAALTRAGISSDIDWLWPWLLVWALVAAVVSLLLPYASESKRRDVAGPSSGSTNAWALHARDVLLLLAAGPLAILLTFAVAKVLGQHPIVGPEPGSWFRRIGWDVSYGVPLAVIALVFIGYAVRDRSSRFAFAAGLLFNVVATIVVLLRLAGDVGGVLDAVAWITVAQANAIVAGVVALVWLAAVMQGATQRVPGREQGERLAPRRVPSGWLPAPSPLLLVTQVALAAALCGTFLVPAAVRLAFEPQAFGWAAAADGVLGWCAVALATAAAVWINGRRGVSQSGGALFGAMLVALVALTATRWDSGNWRAHHTLLVGCCAAAWLVPVTTRAAGRLIAGDAADEAPMVWSAWFLRLFAVAAVLLALQSLGQLPGARPVMPWWTLAGLVAISARNVWIAWYEFRRGFVWIAALLCNLAASIWWGMWGYHLAAATGRRAFHQLMWINVLALAAMAVVSVWVERRIVAQQGESRRWPGIGFHRFAAWAIVVVLLLTTAAGLLADLWGDSFPASLPLAWAAWVAAAAAAIACWWDPAVRWPVACLYCVGLLGVGLYLDGLDFPAPMFHWALANALAAYSLATSTLWSGRDRLRVIARRLGVPISPTVADQPAIAASAARWTAWHAGEGHGWLVPMNFLIGVGVLLLVWWIELEMPDFGQRMIAAYAVGAQAVALGLLARGAVRTPLQYLALVWGVLFAVAFGWAWLPPDFPAPWLHRLVVTVAALAVTVVVYGFGLVKFLKRENEWTRAAARLVPPLAVLAAALILVVLGIETVAYLSSEKGELPIAWPALLAVGLALAGLAAAALVAALVPGRDPLGLSERGRTLYVYAAEALAGLLFLHIRVTMPWLFSGWFLRFWPLIVMVIAFVGVGVGELFQRRRQRVLSEPLQNTGALLPLLPALAFWVMSSQLYQVHYSLLLLSIGALYAALSVLRQSFAYGVLAAVAVNTSLWYLLYKGEGLGLLEHPQLWLIPPALCALAAGYINRARLTDEQSTALRYASAIVIYVSSTADVFINGVAEAPWLPAVLAGLSILGVFAGIMLRVRAFLYLGTSFLLVAILTVIWHAAVEQERTYIWWVAGIVTGVLIIALFGLFEKRREDVLRVVEQFKHWEA